MNCSQTWWLNSKDKQRRLLKHPHAHTPQQRWYKNLWLNNPV
jgi:hypothetical protein